MLRLSQIAPTDTLFEVKQYLHDSSMLYFFSNYHFTHDGKQLNEYLDIASFNLDAENTLLDIKLGRDIHKYQQAFIILTFSSAAVIVCSLLDPFDEKSAKHHLKKV